MGALSTKKFIKQNGSGYMQEENALTTSAGAGDANKIPALNASGFLDQTIVNAKTTSAGAGDSGKIPALDGSGRLDNSFLPVGIGADTAQILASETLAEKLSESLGCQVTIAGITLCSPTILQET